MASSSDLLKKLEGFERDISHALQSAGQAIQELSKEKPAVKLVESHTTNFLTKLDAVENGLAQHLTYLTKVSTGQAHEGSCYGSQKDLQMAWFRFQHVRSRLAELERLKGDHLRARQQMMQPRVPAADASPMHRGFTQTQGGALQSLQKSFSMHDPTQGIPRNFPHEPHQ